MQWRANLKDAWMKNVVSMEDMGNTQASRRQTALSRPASLRSRSSHTHQAYFVTTIKKRANQLCAHWEDDLCECVGDGLVYATAINERLQ